MVLLGRSVVSAGRRGRGDLELMFDEHKLIFHDDSPYYESYTISIGQDHIPV